MKKFVSDSRRIIDRFDAYSRNELVAALDDAIAALPEEQRGSVMFEMDEYSHPYDPNTYYAFFIKWTRPETDAEESKREAEEAKQLAAIAKRERAEFERLKKQFGE